ncbi:MAG: T9SS type A sorting domain-containing protein [Calditrichota bacterium]
MKTFCLIALLALAGVVWGQTPAPVEWGDVRWFGIGNVPRTFHPALLMGDTLVLAGAVPDQSTPPLYCPAVVYSHDNGNSFSTWQCLDTAVFSGHIVNIMLQGSDGRAFALVDAGILRSLDGGMTWINMRPRPPNTSIVDWKVVGQQVIAIERYQQSDSVWVYSMIISDDGGNHWRNGIPLPTEIPDIYGLRNVGATQGNTILLARDRSWPYPIAVSVGNRDGSNWSPFSVLAGPSRINAKSPVVVGDSSSQIAMVHQLIEQSGWDVDDIFVNRTTDGGQTWDSARNLSVGRSLNGYTVYPELFYRGELWGVAWEDFWNQDSTQWGVYWRLSANRGKDWYPAQRVGPDCPNLSYSGGQFVGNAVHLYWIDQWHDYASVSGTMTEDTTRPDVFVMLFPRDTIRIGDTLEFLAEVVDNDTLSEVRLTILDDNNQQTNISLISIGNHQFYGTFIIPHAGIYRYSCEAEDFWENVGCDPDTGWAVFVTDGWSEARESSILHPASFNLSAYPNPFNATTTLSFSLPHTSLVSLTVFNLLGQAVNQADLGMLNAGEHRHFFDASELPSGVYLARVQAGERSQMRKMVLLR